MILYLGVAVIVLETDFIITPKEKVGCIDDKSGQTDTRGFAELVKKATVPARNGD